MTRPLLLLVLAALCGCGPEPVTTYRIPKEGPAPDPASLAESGGHVHSAPAPAMAGAAGDMANASGIATASGGPITFAAPDGWSEGRPSSMRIASFAAADGAVDISVTAFPGDVGGVLGNINRWRGQVGLGPISEALVDDFHEKLHVGGLDAYLVDTTGPAGADGSAARLIAVGVERQGQTFFFKMSGPASAVAAEESAFRAFLNSVDFASNLPEVHP